MWHKEKQNEIPFWSFWRQMFSLARGGLVTSKPRTNDTRREKGQRSRPKKGRRAWGMQWLKWSGLSGTGASAQLAEIAQDLGAGGDKSHQNCMKAMLGGGGCLHRSATLSDGSAS